MRKSLFISLAAVLLIAACTADWLSGVAATGAFHAAGNFDGWTKDSTSGIPEGWSVVTYSSMIPWPPF